MEKFDSLRPVLREYAMKMREFALEVDRTYEMPSRYLNDKSFFTLWRMGVPKEYGNEGLKGSDGKTYYGETSLENAIWTEELAYGDPGMLIGMPGPQLLGPIVKELGTKEQQDRFFESFMGDEATWTGFNLTEEKAGSDVSGLQTVMRSIGEDTYRLYGEKKYVANAERAQWVCTFAKMGDVNNPFAIQSLLIHESEYGEPGEVELDYSRSLGMRGARLGQTRYNGLTVRRDQVLGWQKSPLRRGLRGAVNVFFHMRPCTSSIAIGLSRTMIDYVREQIPLTAYDELQIDKLQWKMEKARLLVYRAASEVDNGIFKSQSSSMGKWMANRNVYDTSRAIVSLVGPDALVDHPLLEKWLRDARMIEFMEGSTNIHKREVGQDLLQIR